MARRISLREFQENLVKRLAETRSGDRRTLLGVEAGGKNWLVELTDTGEILPVPPISPVPLTRSWFRGIANVRGTLYGIVDFAAFHGDPAILPAGLARLLVIHGRHGVNSALLFSRTSGLHSPEEFEADPSADTATDRPAWVAGTFRDMQDRVWLKLDMKKLISQHEFLEAGLARA